MDSHLSTNRSMDWALIGCGSAGKSHAKWASSTPGVVIRGFSDAQADAAKQLHGEYGGEYHTTNPERIFADPAVDIVSIATSHSSHADLAVAALNAKKHLFLEKPMAMTTADCLRIHEAMRVAGTKLMIDFTIRFSGAARAIKQRLNASKVSHAQCMVAKGDLSRWQWDSKEGGGPLFDVGVHALDLLCWMHDSDPIEAHATGGRVTHPGELEGTDIVDTAAATLRFANGSVATFLMSDAGRNTMVSKWFFEFFDGEESAVLYEHFKKVTFGDGETLSPPPLKRLPRLVEAIRDDTEPYVPARAGILSTLLVEKIIASIQTGLPQKVEFPL
ncbi:MAG: Gfo/Idh/MocA family oxidoreductase [Candidatus Poribacteria bacterium]|nr:Gfo/Idh/MocA family oxidoreductase [Candidatus Poribacteria bacterium]